MSWRVDEAYLQGLNFFDAVVDRVPDDAWQAPSPCEGWRTVDVLGHVGAATDYGSQLLAGEAPAWRPIDPPGDAVAFRPGDWWRSIFHRAGELAGQLDMEAEVDTPAGQRTVAEGLSFPAVDLFVHGWDVARSAGIEVEIPAEAAEFSHSVLDGLPDDQLRSPKVFASEKTVPGQASPTEIFIAWTGRDPLWLPRR